MCRKWNQTICSKLSGVDLELYLAWIDASPTKEDALRREFGDIINPAEQVAVETQRQMRDDNPAIDALLAKWEYNTAIPATFEGEVERQKILQGAR